MLRYLPAGKRRLRSRCCTFPQGPEARGVSCLSSWGGISPGSLLRSECVSVSVSAWFGARQGPGNSSCVLCLYTTGGYTSPSVFPCKTHSPEHKPFPWFWGTLWARRGELAACPPRWSCGAGGALALSPPSTFGVQGAGAAGQLAARTSGRCPNCTGSFLRFSCCQSNEAPANFRLSSHRALLG